MQSRALGASGLSIAPIVLGGNVFGWTIDEPQSFAILDAFTDRGFNCIDTADIYSLWKPGNHGGESETIIGNWFKRSSKRDKVILTTKVGLDLGGGRKGLSKKYILEEVETSLRNLKTDYIDLYQSHRDDPETPIEETLEAYALLIDQGKIRAIAASNFTADRLTAAMDLSDKNKLPTYTALEPEYNLYDRQNYEQNLVPIAGRFNLGVIPYFSLASGFLTGKYKSKDDTKGANRGSRVEKYFTPRGEKILKALEAVAQDTGETQASISLAWLLAQPTITAPIASATKVSHLESMFAAVDLKLEKSALDKLTQASAY
jgi:aryl-alcohol dehydrogenase-like predicted oxidoreductase